MKIRGKTVPKRFENVDKRGRKHLTKKKTEVISKAKAHIECFPAVESHYIRKSNEKNFL